MKQCEEKRLAKNSIKALKSSFAADSMISDWSTVVIIMICIAADTIFLFGVTDELFYQSVQMSVMVAIMVAFSIDVLPVIIAAKFQKERRDGLDYILLIACILVLVALIVSIFALRWSMMDKIYSGGDSLIVSSALSSSEILSENAAYEASPAEKTMTIIMSLIPLSTSLITFAFATNKSRNQKRFERVEMTMLRCEAQKRILRAKIHETERELGRDLDLYETKQYEIFQKTLNSITEVLDGQAKTELALKLASPEAALELLEELEDEGLKEE